MTKMNKLSSRHHKISSRDDSAIIKKMKEVAKNDEEMISKFKEYGVSIDEIDSVPVAFCELDVSAKTKNKKIYINSALLRKNEDPTHYLIHELVHFLQQFTKKNLNKGNAEDSYLDKETELEAFKSQVDFKKRNEGEEEAKEYVSDLLDYHDVDGEERKEKKEELLEE